MSGWRRWLFATCGLAVLIHAAVILVLPYALVTLTSHAVGSRAGFNQPFYARPQTADSRAVVRPNPDLLYAGCRFDLREHPLRIDVPNAPTYWSLSLYAANTDNFYVLDDRQAMGATASIIVVAADAPYPRPGGAPVVVAPTATGVAFYRLLTPGYQADGDAAQVQHRFACHPLP